MTGPQTGPLPRSVRLAFVTLTLVAAMGLTAIAVFALENRKRANEGQRAHNALCVVKANFQVRRNRTAAFLRANPGPLILGIPRREFERSLADTQETLRALNGLICIPPSKPTTTLRP